LQGINCCMLDYLRIFKTKNSGNDKQAGFTLIELSIVIVIIGLIVGGVVGGSTMMRQAKLKSVITDISKIQTALNMFQDKYDALPGDMKTATSYWPSCTDSGSNTCNGNGDGQIIMGSDPAGALENLRAWQHLALAGVIEGSYNGVPISSAVKPKQNILGGKISDSGYNFRYFGSPISYGIESKNVIQFGTSIYLSGTSNHEMYLDGAVLTGAEAYSIDSKIDDGQPQNGKVAGTSGWGPSGNTGGCSLSTTAYKLDSTASQCRMWFQLMN
jgi:prepilin-type N-terminal cleavage/methylation domain-containing protein